MVTVGLNETVTGIDFGNTIIDGGIRGRLWFDLNRDGVRMLRSHLDQEPLFTWISMTIRSSIRANPAHSPTHRETTLSKD